MIDDRAHGLAASALRVRLGGRPVLDEVDVAFRPGEVTAVLGPNGAGKSTLLTCLVGLRAPDLGEVRLDGRPLAAFSPRERARRIAYLPQTPEIAWRLDVHTFVRLGRTAHRGIFGETSADAQAVDRALTRTGMSAFTRRDVTTLSGGERARALIARALAGEPDWLVADEPLTGLDLAHQLDAAALLREVAAAGVGVVATLHDLALAAHVADRAVVLAEGRCLAEGAPMQALTPDVLARAYGVRARWVDGGRAPLLDILAPDGTR